MNFLRPSGLERCPMGARSATSATTTGTCIPTWPVFTRRMLTKRCTVWKLGEDDWRGLGGRIWGGRGELWGKKWRRCLLMQQTLEMMKAWGDGVRVSFFGQCGWAGSGAAYVLLPLPLLRIAPEPGVDVKANKESWLRTLTNLFFSSPNVSINLYGGSDSGQQQTSSDDSWSLELNDHRALKRPEASFDGDLSPSWWLSI